MRKKMHAGGPAQQAAPLPQADSAMRTPIATRAEALWCHHNAWKACCAALRVDRKRSTAPAVTYIHAASTPARAAPAAELDAGASSE